MDNECINSGGTNTSIANKFEVIYCSTVATDAPTVSPTMVTTEANRNMDICEFIFIKADMELSPIGLCLSETNIGDEFHTKYECQSDGTVIKKVKTVHSCVYFFVFFYVFFCVCVSYMISDGMFCLCLYVCLSVCFVGLLIQKLYADSACNVYLTDYQQFENDGTNIFMNCGNGITCNETQYSHATHWTTSSSNCSLTSDYTVKDLAYVINECIAYGSQSVMVCLYIVSFVYRFIYPKKTKLLFFIFYFFFFV